MRHRPGVVLILLTAVATAVFAWAARGPVTRQSLAVRFEYDSNGSADDARIADGIAIEITRQLAQIDGLDVRGAVRASRYSDPREDTHVFARARGAGLVLEGLVLVDAGVVRQIHASLVSASSGRILWSRHLTPQNDDIFAVHGVIADAVAESLGLRFGPDHRLYSIDPVLQTTLLRARALQADGGSISRPEATDLFGRITKQAPAFAPAFAALATTVGGHLSIAGPTPIEPRMAAAARAAYQADSRSAEANHAMGLLSARTCQWSSADTYFAAALRMDPSATAAQTDYVISALLPLGRFTDALEVLRAALDAHPSSADVRRTLTYVHLQNNDYASALESSRWVIDRHPDLEFADQSYGRALYLSRRTEEALEWFSKRESQWGHRGYVLALMGHRDEARALADAHPGEPARQLLIYAGLKDVERAVDALRRTALDNPWRALVWMGWPEIVPVLRSDPRAAAIRAHLLRPADEGGCVISSPDAGRFVARTLSGSRVSGPGRSGV